MLQLQPLGQIVGDKALRQFIGHDGGTDRDPKLKNDLAKGYFTDRTLAPTSGL
jgi:hypothetical protein